MIELEKLKPVEIDQIWEKKDMAYIKFGNYEPERETITTDLLDGTFIEVKVPKRVINYETPTSEIPFTPECSKIIERLTTEIFRYIDGDRAQDKLNFDD